MNNGTFVTSRLQNFRRNGILSAATATGTAVFLTAFFVFGHGAIAKAAAEWTVDADTYRLYRLEDVSNAASVEGALVNNGGVVFAPGQFNNAATFNVNNFLSGSFSTSSDGSSPINRMTFIIWFNLANTSGNQEILYVQPQFGVPQNDSWSQQLVNVSGTLHFSSQNLAQFSAPIAAGTWYNAIMTYQYDGNASSSFCAYLDGELVNCAQGAHAIGQAGGSPNGFSLGLNCYNGCGANPTTHISNGSKIDELVILKRIFSTQEAAAYYGPQIANLSQFKSDATTAIPEGGTTTEDTIVFSAILNSLSASQLRLEVEVEHFGTAFTNQPNATSAFVVPGSLATTTINNLTDGSYHWQARVVDSQGNASDWQEFGAAGNVDFVVSLPLPTKAANLTKQVVNGPYLGDGDTFGGKGWDPVRAEYVSANLILSGYNFWNNKLREVDFGAGVDCSGLIQWAFNRAFDPKKSLLNNVIRWDGANGQYLHNSTTTTEVNLRPGDLMFFDGEPPVGHIDHVAMYVGDFVSNNETFDIVQAATPQAGIIPSKKDILKTRPEFLALGSNGFRRVVFSPEIGGQLKASSPIDLTVTDPDGFTLTPTTAIQTSREYLREIPGELYYTENVLGADGRPEDIVYWPAQKTGDYLVKVLPEAGASQTETYSVEFTSGEQTTVLASDVPLSQRPPEGYGVNITDSGTISTFVPVAIDIKPGSFPNSINLKSDGVTPVAILGSATFDVKQVDTLTIKLADASVKLKNNGQPMASYGDIDEDGFTDLVAHVSTKSLQLTKDDIKANLEGKLIDGTIVKGRDSVRIVP